MSVDIQPTTAEHIIGATDAVLLKNCGCDANFVAEFLDIPLDSANNALAMSTQLKLINFLPTNSLYYPSNPFATYLVTSNEQQKSAIIRLVLEQYEPYKIFKDRLLVSGLIHTAAEQVRVLFGLTVHRDIIKDTLTSLGTFAQSLVSIGAGLYNLAETSGERTEYLLRVNEVVSDRERSSVIVKKLIGNNGFLWIDQTETFEPLVTAYQKLVDCQTDPRSPILYSGNAFESFLVKFAAHFGVSLVNSNGINAKIDELSRNGYIKSKHKFMGKYLGHVRNACDHGVDAEIHQTWQITPKTSHEYVHITMTCIQNLVESLNGIYQI